jgi:hypothetical protein
LLSSVSHGGGVELCRNFGLVTKDKGGRAEADGGGGSGPVRHSSRAFEGFGNEFAEALAGGLGEDALVALERGGEGGGGSHPDVDGGAMDVGEPRGFGDGGSGYDVLDYGELGQR